MLAIDPLAGAVAGAILFGILQYVRRTVRVARWADSGRSLRLQQIRENLVGLAADPEHPRDWRPVILAFSEHPERRAALLRFASWIEGGSGFVTAVRVVEADALRESPLRHLEAEIEKDIEALGYHGIRPGGSRPTRRRKPCRRLLSSHGIGALRANTVLVNRLPKGAEPTDETPARACSGSNSRTAHGLGCNLVVLDSEPSEIVALDATRPEPAPDRRLVPGGRLEPARPAARLPHHPHRRIGRTPGSGSWPRAPSTMSEEQTRETLPEMLSEVRIDAEAIVVDRIDPATVLETLRGRLAGVPAVHAARRPGHRARAAGLLSSTGRACRWWRSCWLLRTSNWTRIPRKCRSLNLSLNPSLNLILIPIRCLLDLFHRAGLASCAAADRLSRLRGWSMARSSLILLWIVLIAAGVGGTLQSYADTPDPQQESADPALDLNQYVGQVVYLDFWASWCAPCKQSFPWMIALQDQLDDQGLVIVTVNVDRDRKAAERFLEKLESDLPVIYDPEGEIAAAYELEGMPSSYIYDRAGVLRASHIGFNPDQAEEIEEQLLVLLAEEVEDAQGD